MLFVSLSGEAVTKNPPPPGWIMHHFNFKKPQGGSETILNSTTDSILKLRVKKDYEIFDAKGKLVLKGNGKEIDVSSLPAGKYTVKFDKDYNQIEYFKKI